MTDKGLDGLLWLRSSSHEQEKGVPPDTLKNTGLPGDRNDTAVAPVNYGADSAEPTPSRTELPSVPGYDILEELGRGRMGMVYKAGLIGLDSLVALRMRLAGKQASLDVVQRFITEARAVASLQHPNIVQLYEINLDQDRP